MPFASLGRFIPKYHYSFGHDGKWDCFLNFSSGLSLLVYRNAGDFCVLIFYPENLLNSLICCSIFL